MTTGRNTRENRGRGVIQAEEVNNVRFTSPCLSRPFLSLFLMRGTKSEEGSEEYVMNAEV
jgi:hypothetical protein